MVVNPLLSVRASRRGHDSTKLRKAPEASDSVIPKAATAGPGLATSATGVGTGVGDGVGRGGGSTGYRGSGISGPHAASAMVSTAAAN